MPVTLPQTPLAAQADLDALAARVSKLEQGSSTMPSPDNTWISSPSDKAILDDWMNAYTLVATAGKGNQIAKNAAIDPPTQNVTKLGILSRKVHQQNQAGAWYVDTATGKTNTTAWAQESDPTAPAPQPPSGAFRVSGGKIVDSKGNAFRAKGPNCNYTQVWGNHQVDLDRFSLANLQRAFPGLNFVRFANWGGQLAPVGDAKTVAWTNDLTSHGVVVMYDLHYTGDAISPSDATANGWFNGWAGFWKANPMVWFASQNEPHGYGTNISAMMKGQYNAVRSAGSSAIMLLACGNPGGETTGMAQSDFASMTNAAFDAHYYGWMPQNGISWQEILHELSGFHSQDGAMPVLCLETGDSTDGNNRDGNWQDVLNQSLSNPAGFACWYWNWDTNGADRLLAAPFDGSQLTDYGQVVRSAIQSG